MSYLINTLTAYESSISYSPTRGGMITGFLCKGHEVLYFDEQTFADSKQSIRGGIPILFPRMGELPYDQAKSSGIFSDLLVSSPPRHGFLRNMERREQEKTTSSVSLSCTSTAKTKELYLYDFTCAQRYTITPDGFLEHVFAVQNTGTTPLPFCMGIHPYFPVPHEQKKDIGRHFSGGETIADQFTTWANDGTTVVDLKSHPTSSRAERSGVERSLECTKEAISTPLQISIPNLGLLHLDLDPLYTHLRIRSQPGKNFVCIEPMMGKAGNFLTRPTFVAPGEIRELRFNIRVE